MRIGLEMFGTQTAGRHRGIGRYSRNLAGALLARCAQSDTHELILYADAEGPRDLLPTGAPVGTRWIGRQPTLGRAVDRLVRENPHALDVLVLLNPLELTPGYDLPARPEAVPGRRTPALAAVVYDLIPVIFAGDYLLRWPGPTMVRRYRWALERLRQYDRLLAISDSSRHDLIDVLNVSASRVVTIGGAVDDPGLGFTFDMARPGDEASDRAALEALGVFPPFVFAVSADDPRKNLGGLLAAYARLPIALRTTHRLVIAAGIGPTDPRAAPIWSQADALGIRSRLTLTGTVDDATLRALYRRCAAFVFPSLYEGFGLPILEALACGAPAVAGDNSSQPEVAGDAALLVNAADPGALAAAIARLLTDPTLARTLRSRGPTRAARFTWDAVAVRTLQALETLGAPTPHREPTASPRPDARARVAVFAPDLPHPSVESVPGNFRIDLFHAPGAFPSARYRIRNAGCYDARLFPRWNRLRPYARLIPQDAQPRDEPAPAPPSASTPGANRPMTRLLRGIWNRTEIIRKPVRNRVAQFITACLARSLETSELSEVLDALVTEQFRLQEKIDGLERRIEELTSPFECEARSGAATVDVR